MRSPKALFVLLFFCFFSFASQAQVSLFAGPQLTTAKYHIRNARQQQELKPGFMAGVRLTTQVEGPLYFAPSLYFSQKGYKVSFNQSAVLPDSAARNNNTTIQTLALAPLLQFNLSRLKNHFFIRFGPAVEINLSGHETFDSAAGKTVSRQMVFGSLGYSPATAYANVHFGYAHKSGLSVFAHYEHGLSNFNNADFGPMILHRVLGVSVEWRLGRK